MPAAIIIILLPPQQALSNIVKYHFDTTSIQASAFIANELIQSQEPSFDLLMSLWQMQSVA